MLNRKPNKSENSVSNLSTKKVSNLSYELRTRLNTILGFLDILSTEDLGPLNVNQHDAISRIDKSSSKLKDSIEDILKFSEGNSNHKVEIATLKANVNYHAWLIRGLFATLVLAVGWVLSERSELLKDVELSFKKASLRHESFLHKIDSDLDKHLNSHEHNSRAELKRLREKLDAKE